MGSATGLLQGRHGEQWVHACYISCYISLLTQNMHLYSVKELAVSLLSSCQALFVDLDHSDQPVYSMPASDLMRFCDGIYGSVAIQWV